jgi:hypothetical protein
VAGGVKRGVLGTVAVSVALLVPASANASEHVLDGGFEAVTACDPSDCTSPVWAEALAGGASTGPLCQVGTQNCGQFQGPTLFPFAGTKWAQLGGETTMSPTLTYAIQQVVNIPGPAILTFQLSSRNSNVSTGAFTVKIDGTPVYAAGGSDSPYATVTVDLSAFAGGLRTLRFENFENGSSGSRDSFNVDDVSIQDRPPATPVTTPKKKCKKGKKLRHGKCRKKHKKH